MPIFNSSTNQSEFLKVSIVVCSDALSDKGSQGYTAKHVGDSSLIKPSLERTSLLLAFDVS